MAQSTRRAPGAHNNASTIGGIQSPEALARTHGLKKAHASGKTEWHGPNPSGHGASTDGFILNEDGTAYDRSQNQHYTSREVAGLFSIAPEQYAPVVEFQERSGHSQNGHHQARPKAPTANNSQARPKAARAPFDWKRARVFTYRDGGAILFQVGRCDAAGREKAISQRRPVDPECRDEENAGGWIYGLSAGTYNPRGADFYPAKSSEPPQPNARHFPECRRTLYRRADVLDAQTVFICEGEKAADALNDALMSAGLYGEHTATTNPHGAGKWTGERGGGYSGDLAGKRVVFLPDHDAQGEQHAATACPSIAAGASSLQVLRLPDLPEKGDVADFLSAGGTVEQVLALAAAVPMWTPDEAPGQAEEAPQIVSQADDEIISEAAPRRRITILTATQLRERPAPRALIRDVLFENAVAEICGAAASYKSFQGIAAAEAIAGGHEWHGRATKQTPVVYITGEGAGGLTQRIQALENRYQRPCEAMFIPEAVQMHRPDEVEALLWAINQLPQEPGLIVVDTLARCFVGGDENSAKDAGLFVAGLDRIRSASGAAVLVLHHLNKSGESRGSTAFSGAMDTIIEARRENTTVTLRCLKQKDAPEFEPLTLVRRVIELDGLDEFGRPLTSLTFEPTDAPMMPMPSRSESIQRQVLEVLRQEFPNGAKVSKWAEACKKKGVPNGSFYDARTALVECGQVLKEGASYRLR